MLQSEPEHIVVCRPAEAMPIALRLAAGVKVTRLGIHIRKRGDVSIVSAGKPVTAST